MAAAEMDGLTPRRFSIHLVPVFLGGMRLCNQLSVSPGELEYAGGKQLTSVTHLRFRFRQERADA